MQARQRGVYLLLALIVLLGLAIRLYELDKRTMTHIEIYVPGIPLPEGLADPSPRLSVTGTLRSMIGSMEPHPPGYYLMMLAWTKIFGSGIGWLRLPSVLFGTASIFLVFLLGWLEKNTTAGLLAALLVALNGHQVFWSQLAKNYIAAEFFGLAATLLLLLALRRDRRERAYQLAYLGVVLLGLFFTIYFWPVLVVHMLWVLVENLRAEKLPGMFQVQFLAFLAGTPLISLAIFQARRDSYLPSNFWPSLGSYLGFGYAVEDIPFVFSQIPGIGFLPFILLAVGIIFLWAGLGKARDEKEPGTSKGIHVGILLATVLLATGIIFVTGRFLALTFPEAGRNMILSAALPAILFALYFGLDQFWKRKNRGMGQSTGHSHTPGWNYQLSAYLAVLPVLLVALATPVSAIFASRGVLLYTPYLLLILSAGALALIGRSRAWAPVLFLILFLLPVGGLFFRHSTLEHPTDYKAMAEKWIPEIQEGDLIFVRKSWFTTPIFYYLDSQKYQVIGDLQPDSYASALQDRPNSRIWVLTNVSTGPGSALKEALSSYQVIESLQASNLEVDLYVRQRAAP